MLRQLFPAIPVAFSQTVFNGDNRIFLNQFIIPCYHFICCLGALSGFFQIVHLCFCIIELTGRNVHRNADILTGTEAGSLDCFHNTFQRRFIIFQVWRKSTLITDSSDLSLALQHFFQGMEGFSTHTNCFANAFCAYRHNHKLLKIHRRIRMTSAV